MTQFWGQKSHFFRQIVDLWAEFRVITRGTVLKKLHIQVYFTGQAYQTFQGVCLSYIYVPLSVTCIHGFSGPPLKDRLQPCFPLFSVAILNEIWYDHFIKHAFSRDAHRHKHIFRHCDCLFWCKYIKINLLIVSLIYIHMHICPLLWSNCMLCDTHTHTANSCE